MVPQSQSPAPPMFACTMQDDTVSNPGSSRKLIGFKLAAAVCRR